MNRRKLLSLIGATALTPVIPPQVFASGGIVNPEHCGFITGPVPCELMATRGTMIGIDPISMFLNITGENLTR